MEKQSLILVLNGCFNEEGNFAILHFVDGSELIVDNKPQYFSSHMKIEISYDVNREGTVNEEFVIPFSSVLYITLSNVKNLDILSKRYESVGRNKDVFFYDKLTEEIE